MRTSAQLAASRPRLTLSLGLPTARAHMSSPSLSRPVRSPARRRQQCRQIISDRADTHLEDRLKESARITHPITVISVSKLSSYEEPVPGTSRRRLLSLNPNPSRPRHIAWSNYKYVVKGSFLGTPFPQYSEPRATPEDPNFNALKNFPTNTRRLHIGKIADASGGFNRIRCRLIFKIRRSLEFSAHCRVRSTEAGGAPPW